MLGGIVVAIGGVALLTQVGAADGPGVLVAADVILSLGLRAAVHTGRRPRDRKRSPRASRRRVGDLGDQLELEGALGLAILGTVGTAVYRDRTADAFSAEVPADVAEAASDTLAGAVAVADRLPRAYAADVSSPPARPSRRGSRSRPR